MDALSLSLHTFSLTRGALHISAEIHHFLIRKKNPSRKWYLLKIYNCSALGYFLWFIQSQQQTNTLNTDCILFIQPISIPCLPLVRPTKGTEDKTASMTQSLFSRSLVFGGEDSQLHYRVMNDRMDMTQCNGTGGPVLGWGTMWWLGFFTKENNIKHKLERLAGAKEI